MKMNILNRLWQARKVILWIVAGILFLEVGYWVFDYYQTKFIMEKLANQKEEVKPEPVLLFDLPVDSFKIVPGFVRSGQNLSTILVREGISMAKVDEIYKKSMLTFDFRRMKTNDRYYFFKNKKDSAKIDYFIYESSVSDYVVYNLKDSLQIKKGKKPIITQVKEASGVINSSLWKTFSDQNLNTDLALILANEVYPWSIDFYGLQKGDRFRIVFEENYVFGKSIGVGRIFAAQFIHAKDEFYAFRFTQELEGKQDESYYNEKGQSLKKAFLKAPLKFSRISSQFSNSRFHPVLKIYRAHHGIDYAAPTGTPVMSIGDGVVIEKGYQASGGGNYLKIKHNSAYTTVYMHLSKFGAGIVKGARVKQSDVIGYVGATGLASGPHLDFRVFLNGTAINPLNVKSEPGVPIQTKYMDQYKAHMDSLKTRLESVKFS